MLHIVMFAPVALAGVIVAGLPEAKERLSIDDKWASLLLGLALPGPADKLARERGAPEKGFPWVRRSRDQLALSNCSLTLEIKVSVFIGRTGMLGKEVQIF